MRISFSYENIQGFIQELWGYYKGVILIGLLLSALIVTGIYQLATRMSVDDLVWVFAYLESQRGSPWFFLGLWMVFVLRPALLIPGVSVAPAVFVLGLFGPWEALGILLLGSMSAATTGYFLGYLLRSGSGKVLRFFRLSSVSRSPISSRRGFRFVILLRLSQIPLDYGSYIAGFRGVDFSSYMRGTAAGIFPGTVVMCFAAQFAGELIVFLTDFV